MKVLIIEDEAPAYRRLIKLIGECDSSVEIAGIIQTVKEGIEWFGKYPPPDLIFSDIQLADDLSFTIFKELNITIPIIFVTAFDEYAINTFKFYSIDYLLKPVSAEDLKAGLEKYKTINQQRLFGDFDDLVKKLTEKHFRERFLVYQGDSHIPLHCDDIACFTSEDGATILITHTNKRYFIDETLDALESELDERIFFRATRQFILSLKSIVKIHNWGQQKLKVIVRPEPAGDIIISKLKATQFKKWLNK
jgi:two-component system, LytTR family, response regulator LytT